MIAGALLCNAIPHLAAGLQGRAFATPFAKPSPAWANVLWGALNLLIAVLLLGHLPIRVGLSLNFVGLAAGFVALGLYLAWRFGSRAE
ncbi:hypothetical protein FGG78_38155 [Thioclava sp. BHET1]|nr:hypothetical protein FGG78_38155 [Thioclava sp. BHET1]